MYRNAVNKWYGPNFTWRVYDPIVETHNSVKFRMFERQSLEANQNIFYYYLDKKKTKQILKIQRNADTMTTQTPHRVKLIIIPRDWDRSRIAFSFYYIRFDYVVCMFFFQRQSVFSGRTNTLNAPLDLQICAVDSRYGQHAFRCNTGLSIRIHYARFGQMLHIPCVGSIDCRSVNTFGFWFREFDCVSALCFVRDLNFALYLLLSDLIW